MVTVMYVCLLYIWNVDDIPTIVPASGCLDGKKVFTTYHPFDEDQIREDFGLHKSNIYWNSWKYL